MHLVKDFISRLQEAINDNYKMDDFTRKISKIRDIYSILFAPAPSKESIYDLEKLILSSPDFLNFFFQKADSVWLTRIDLFNLLDAIKDNQKLQYQFLNFILKGESYTVYVDEDFLKSILLFDNNPVVTSLIIRLLLRDFPLELQVYAFDKKIGNLYNQDLVYYREAFTFLEHIFPERSREVLQIGLDLLNNSQFLQTESFKHLFDLILQGKPGFVIQCIDKFEEIELKGKNVSVDTSFVYDRFCTYDKNRGGFYLGLYPIEYLLEKMDELIWRNFQEKTDLCPDLFNKLSGKKLLSFHRILIQACVQYGFDYFCRVVLNPEYYVYAETYFPIFKSLPDFWEQFSPELREKWEKIILNIIDSRESQLQSSGMPSSFPLSIKNEINGLEISSVIKEKLDSYENFYRLHFEEAQIENPVSFVSLDFRMDVPASGWISDTSFVESHFTGKEFSEASMEEKLDLMRKSARMGGIEKMGWYETQKIVTNEFILDPKKNFFLLDKVLEEPELNSYADSFLQEIGEAIKKKSIPLEDGSALTIRILEKMQLSDITAVFRWVCEKYADLPESHKWKYQDFACIASLSEDEYFIQNNESVAN